MYICQEVKQNIWKSKTWT